jgi:hypothetical protein
VLCTFSALFKQARQQRVTDKGKEKPGTQPAPHYGPHALQSTPDAQPADLLTVHNAEHATGASSLSEDATPRYRSGDIVVVRPLRSQLWIAQLCEPVIETSPGCFNVDRPRCRYFVLTAELAAYPHAAEWWAARTAPLCLRDEEAALLRAASSNGVHFSFEKLDHVTRSTICGTLPAGCLSEQHYHRHELVTFAITDEMLAQAREMVSGESEAERAATEAEEEQAAAKKQAEAAEVMERAEAEHKAADTYSALAAKREAGKEREQRRKQKK